MDTTAPTAPARGSLDAISADVARHNRRCEELIAELAVEAAAMARGHASMSSALTDEISRTPEDQLDRLIDRMHIVQWSAETLATAGRGLGAGNPWIQLRIGVSEDQFRTQIQDAKRDRRARRKEEERERQQEEDERLLRENPALQRVIDRRLADQLVTIPGRRTPRFEGSYSDLTPAQRAEQDAQEGE